MHIQETEALDEILNHQDDQHLQYEEECHKSLMKEEAKARKQMEGLEMEGIADLGRQQRLGLKETRKEELRLVRVDMGSEEQIVRWEVERDWGNGFNTITSLVMLSLEELRIANEERAMRQLELALNVEERLVLMDDEVQARADVEWEEQQVFEPLIFATTFLKGFYKEKRKREVAAPAIQRRMRAILALDAMDVDLERRHERQIIIKAKVQEIQVELDQLEEKALSSAIRTNIIEWEAEVWQFLLVEAQEEPEAREAAAQHALRQRRGVFSIIAVQLHVAFVEQLERNETQLREEVLEEEERIWSIIHSRVASTQRLLEMGLSGEVPALEACVRPELEEEETEAFVEVACEALEEGALHCFWGLYMRGLSVSKTLDSAARHVRYQMEEEEKRRREHLKKLITDKLLGPPGPVRDVSAVYVLSDVKERRAMHASQTRRWEKSQKHLPPMVHRSAPRDISPPRERKPLHHPKQQLSPIRHQSYSDLTSSSKSPDLKKTTTMRF